MKIEKNKIVFFSVVAIVIIFIVAYTTLILMKDEQAMEHLDQPLVPELKEDKVNYTSKLDALNDLKEVHQTDPPSIYSEQLLDSLGAFDPVQEEDDQQRVADSIYSYGSMNYKIEDWGEGYEEETYLPDLDSLENRPLEQATTTDDFSIAHREFFRVTKRDQVLPEAAERTDTLIAARVHGNQVVRVNDRLELILSQTALINGKRYSENTLIYGFVSLQPNRLHIRITHINHTAVDLKAFDLQDSNEGVYVENSFKAEASREVLDDVVQDINITGVPQISGIKNIFRRNNRNLKVTVLDQYELILKPQL
ncbi:hypothetical protein GCM10007103_13050 [Salinimicrobium marinum]|uniref:Conjugative transposon TraM C-terminal domain-containing protein n=1 Tax=Salinimicrobium marinum TaxID=680283 RepID=A0A918SD74_9FLAO|nr:conjugative transposon protein TraM [Salinimicrobium marinum]GHA32992.1 hypothetical protein GCM10007103_13050 [Salinimicrobium marinum]